MMAASIQDPTRARVYEVFQNHILAEASVSGTPGPVLYGGVARRCALVAQWSNREQIEDPRVLWLLDPETWQDGVFRNRQEAATETVLALALQVLSYREPSNTWRRPAAENVLVGGIGAGRMMLVTSEEDLARGDIPPDTIIVSDQIWRTPYPVVAGLILTTNVDIEGAHHLGWFAGIRSPIVCMPDLKPRLHTLAANGRICSLDATGPDVLLREDVSENNAAEIEGNKRPRLDVHVSQPPLELITIDHAHANDPGSVGDKFAGLNGLRKTPKRVAIPSSYERLFLEQAGGNEHDTPSVADTIRSLPFSKVANEVTALFEALVTTFRPGRAQLRFRTSSNYEDRIGAGVAESVIAQCTCPEDLHAAMCAVYASQFTPRACLLRRMFGISPEWRGMAIMVHRSQAADWNGTARVTPSGNDLDVRVFGMRGDQQVTARGSEDPLELRAKLVVPNGRVALDGDVPSTWRQRRVARSIGRVLVQAVRDRGNESTQFEWIVRQPWYTLGAPRVRILQASNAIAQTAHDTNRLTTRPACVETFLGEHGNVLGFNRWIEAKLSHDDHLPTRFGLFRFHERTFLALGDTPLIEHDDIARETIRALPGVEVLRFGWARANTALDADGFYARTLTLFQGAGDREDGQILTVHAHTNEALSHALRQPEALKSFRSWSAAGGSDAVLGRPWCPDLPTGA